MRSPRAGMRWRARATLDCFCRTVGCRRGGARFTASTSCGCSSSRMTTARSSPAGRSACARRDRARCAWPSCASSAISAARPPRRRPIDRSSYLPGREAAACEQLVDRAHRRARLGRARRADDAARARRGDGARDGRGRREARSLGGHGARLRGAAGAPRLGRVRARAAAAAIGRRVGLRDGGRSTSARAGGAVAPLAQGVGGARVDVAGGRSAGRRLLHDMVPVLHAEASCASASSASKGRAIAADLVVTDGERAVSCSVAPIRARRGRRLRAADVRLDRSGRARRRRRFELADDEGPWHASRARVMRLRSWSSTTAGRLHRGVAALTGAMRAIDVGPLAAQKQGGSARPRGLGAPSTSAHGDARLRAARGGARRHLLDACTSIAASCSRATCARRVGSRCRSLTSAPSTAPGGRARSLIARLDLQEAYCRQKWDRGDTVVLAAESGPARRLLWCARTPVYVPDIGREVRPGAGECYIHDVYVHPDERGRQVAPAMLDFLARELRARDVYRAWALIERTNVASTRAFEKAAYASVADVVYARMGLASRLIVRPPDPEARAFLGLLVRRRSRRCHGRQHGPGHASAEDCRRGRADPPRRVATPSGLDGDGTALAMSPAAGGHRCSRRTRRENGFPSPENVPAVWIVLDLAPKKRGSLETELVALAERLAHAAPARDLRLLAAGAGRGWRRAGRPRRARAFSTSAVRRRRRGLLASMVGMGGAPCARALSFRARLLAAGRDGRGGRARGHRARSHHARTADDADAPAAAARGDAVGARLQAGARSGDEWVRRSTHRGQPLRRR